MQYINYPGSYASLDPGFGAQYSELFTGYGGVSSGRVGASTSPQTINQLGEVEARLKEGMSRVEAGATQEEVFEGIPVEHFKEMHRLAKLAGAEVSIHAPIIDPSGFTNQGWTESSKAEAERKLLSVVKRSHGANPEGNIPVTIHASAIPANEWNKSLLKDMPKKLTSKEQAKYDKLPDDQKDEWMRQRTLDYQKEMMVAVNQQTGDITGTKRETVYYPEEGKVLKTPQGRLDLINNTEWENQKFKVIEMKKGMDEMDQGFERARMLAIPAEEKAKKRVPLNDQDKRLLADMQNWEMKRDGYKQEMFTRLQSMYNLARTYGDEDTQSKMRELHKEWREENNELKKVVKRIEKAKGPEREKLIKQFHSHGDVVYNKLFSVLNAPDIKPPEVYAPVEKFAKKQASETLSNVAYGAYKDFGEHTPVVSIENWNPNMAFGTADELKSLITETRKKFVQKAVKDGVDKSTARDMAEKIIGATWDVGHITMLRKHGYEGKDIVKETEKIAPFVKHLHLTDNFGINDSHLAPGMGNVPIKQMMAKLKDAGYNKTAIVEAGNFVANFKTSAHPYALETLQSPVYYSASAGPTWGEARGMAGGYSSYGLFLPEQHFSMYGSGFSSLPAELGGAAPGKGQRFSGAPME